MAVVCKLASTQDYFNYSNIIISRINECHVFRYQRMACLLVPMNAMSVGTNECHICWYQRMPCLSVPMNVMSVGTNECHVYRY